VQAFNSETHLLIARVAYDILQEENPTALKAAEDMLETYSDTITGEREGNYKFVECVTWADDSKRRGGGW
jgi:hypothetical protein